MSSLLGPTRRAYTPRKQYSEEDINSAVNAVAGGMPILRAAKQHGIPFSTLHGRMAKLGYKPPITKTRIDNHL